MNIVGSLWNRNINPWPSSYA